MKLNSKCDLREEWKLIFSPNELVNCNFCDSFKESFYQKGGGKEKK